MKSCTPGFAHRRLWMSLSCAAVYFTFNATPLASSLDLYFCKVFTTAREFLLQLQIQTCLEKRSSLRRLVSRPNQEQILGDVQNEFQKCATAALRACDNACNARSPTETPIRVQPPRSADYSSGPQSRHHRLVCFCEPSTSRSRHPDPEC